MPIYEYICKNCNNTFEEFQKHDDPPLTHCPQCDQDSLVKLVSAPAFHLKGTGWYVTDFRDKDKKSKTEEKVTDQKQESAEKKESTPVEKPVEKKTKEDKE